MRTAEPDQAPSSVHANWYRISNVERSPATTVAYEKAYFLLHVAERFEHDMPKLDSNFDWWSVRIKLLYHHL